MTKSVSATVSALKDDVWLMMMGSNMQQTNNWTIKDRAKGFAPTEVLVKDAFFWEVVDGWLGDVWDRRVHARWVEVLSRLQKVERDVFWRRCIFGKWPSFPAQPAFPSTLITCPSCPVWQLLDVHSTRKSVVHGSLKLLVMGKSLAYTIFPGS